MVDKSPENQVASLEREEELFHDLFERHYHRIYEFFRRRGFSTEDSRDLSQETFLRLFRSLGRFRNEASVSTFLFSIAANVWRNELRSRTAAKRQAVEISLDASELDEDRAEVRGVGHLTSSTSPSDPPQPEPEMGALDQVLTRERLHRVQEALDSLPPTMRRCLQLRLALDLKYSEIATILRVPVGTVKSRLGEARSRLRAELGPVS